MAAIPIVCTFLTRNLGDVIDDCDVVIDLLVCVVWCLGCIGVLVISFVSLLIKLCANLTSSALLKSPWNWVGCLRWTLHSEVITTWSFLTICAR